MRRAARTTIAALGIAAAGAVGLIAPGSAQAASAPATMQPMGCGASAAVVYNGTQIVASSSCSGATNYSAAWSTKLVAQGWSGAVYDTNGTAHYFCDFQTITLNVYTRELYLNATKPARCQ
ncbi:hypothetical protein [Actinacidiphila rubida]|uniref:Uncharacterized protein n=1 Tax=Actinacidiphila rubida TaxID=310780 RepID=A0A1H8U4W6_9ACTN|nr:hypothetical protein [Actinacidiphila rubida]SEO98332.1 hypothetical protein SAMN05216267_106422 [Actinacidiphila rubida]